MTEPDVRPETRVVSAGRPAAGPAAPLSPPVVFSSTYRAGGSIDYGRDGNPTWEAFERAIGELEGGAGTAFSSGMAAATTFLEGLAVGARVVLAAGDGADIPLSLRGPPDLVVRRWGQPRIARAMAMVE